MVAKRSQFCLVGNGVSNNVFKMKSAEYGIRWYEVHLSLSMSAFLFYILLNLYFSGLRIFSQIPLLIFEDQILAVDISEEKLKILRCVSETILRPEKNFH